MEIKVNNKGFAIIYRTTRLKINSYDLVLEAYIDRYVCLSLRIPNNKDFGAGISTGCVASAVYLMSPFKSKYQPEL